MLDKDKIKIGDKVKYMQDFSLELKTGSIYTVDKFRIDQGEIIGVYLKEFPDRWYYLKRFDPVQEKSYSVYKPSQRSIKL